MATITPSTIRVDQNDIAVGVKIESMEEKLNEKVSSSNKAQSTKPSIYLCAPPPKKNDKKLTVAVADSREPSEMAHTRHPGPRVKVCFWGGTKRRQPT